MSPAKLSKAEAGRLGAQTRWGPPRVIRIADLSPERRKLAVAFVNMAREADAKSEAGPASNGPASAEVHGNARSAA